MYIPFSQHACVYFILHRKKKNNFGSYRRESDEKPDGKQYLRYTATENIRLSLPAALKSVRDNREQSAEWRPPTGISAVPTTEFFHRCQKPPLHQPACFFFFPCAPYKTLPKRKSATGEAAISVDEFGEFERETRNARLSQSVDRSIAPKSTRFRRDRTERFIKAGGVPARWNRRPRRENA